MRQETLTTVKGGLNRLRTKGAALNDSLYELLNGYVTTEKTVKVRPGTVLEETLTSGTFGLVSFDGGFHVFASAAVAGLPSNYTLHILRAPDEEDLAAIHFAEPFLGALYVAAEFADGDIYHFWLRGADDWAASTVYNFNQLVTPTSVNGFVYRATRSGDANPLWVAGAKRVVNDTAEPSVSNGYYFEVVQISGTKAISGTVEPDWAAAVEGQLFTESTDGASQPPAPTPPAPPNDNNVPIDVNTRYNARFRGGDSRRFLN